MKCDFLLFFWFKLLIYFFTDLCFDWDRNLNSNNCPIESSIAIERSQCTKYVLVNQRISFYNCELKEHALVFLDGTLSQK